MKYLETEKIELKRSLNNTFEKEVVAFLNTSDGIIYIGVEDNGEVCGVEKLDETMKKISDIIFTSILPNPQELIKVRAIYDDNKFVIEVIVRKGKALYYISKYGRSSKGCYQRVGTTCRSMSEAQIEKSYISSISLPSFSLIKERSPNQKLSFRVYKIYLDENNIFYDEESFNENNKFLTEKGEYNYQAYLLSDQCDISFKVACWEGENKLSNYLFKKEFGGCCLLKAIDDLNSYMESTHNKVRSYFYDGKLIRKDEYLFDSNVFREAWVNACIHNDYSTHLGPAVYLFSDHLEIFSYGSPLKVQPKDMFLKGISKPINPELASIFMKIGNAEESGKGINTIVKAYGKEIFEYSDTCLIVKIPYNKKVLKKIEQEDDGKNINDGNTDGKNINDGNNDGKIDGKKTNDGNNDGKTDGKKTNDGNNDGKTDVEKTFEEIIAKIIKNNSRITVGEIAEIIGKSKPTVERILKNSYKIKRVGAPRSGYWKIIE